MHGWNVNIIFHKTPMESQEGLNLEIVEARKKNPLPRKTSHSYAEHHI
jgi:hypothetical protein